MAYKPVKEIAARLLAKSGFPRLPNGVAIDVARIARDFCRFDVVEVPDLNLGGPVLGAFLPEYNALMVKANCLEARKRFSIAHELGHAQLEHDYGSAETLFPIEMPVFFRCDETDIDDSTQVKPRPRAEILANKFAAYLLMPDVVLKGEWAKDPDISRCAERLHVSRQALTYRLDELGIHSTRTG